MPTTHSLSFPEVVLCSIVGTLMAMACWWVARKIVNWVLGSIIFDHSPRALHWLWANWQGFFWLPCERCGRYFGGHEVGGRTESFHATCWRCPGTGEEGNGPAQS